MTNTHETPAADATQVWTTPELVDLGDLNNVLGGNLQPPSDNTSSPSHS